MTPEELLRFLLGPEPAKNARRPAPAVLPVDVTGREEPMVFYRDRYGTVAPAREQDRPRQAPKPRARAVAGASADPDIMRRIAAHLGIR